MDSEFHDWELLHSGSELGTAIAHESPESQDAFSGTGHQTEVLIKANYFSIDSQTTTVIVSGRGSEESDNLSWLDPELGDQSPRKNLSGFCSDSGSEKSEDWKLEEKKELSIEENSNTQVGSERIEETGSENTVQTGEFEGKTEVGFVEKSKLELGLGGIEEIGSENGKNLEEFWSDSGGVGLGDVKFGDVEERSAKEDSDTNESEKRDEIVEGKVSKAGERKSSMVWWKVPLELLRYCVFRVRPMWAFSVAAAVMGFVIIGRRLYKMKKKAKGLELKVTVDDKKVSQFMSRAARLNEAFSVVKRIPVIRPQLPAPGVSQWPIVSLR